MKPSAFLDHVESCPVCAANWHRGVLCTEGTRRRDELVRAIAPMPKPAGQA